MDEVRYEIVIRDDQWIGDKAEFHINETIIPNLKALGLNAEIKVCDPSIFDLDVEAK